MFGLPLRPSIKSSVSPSRTDFHAENERVLRLSVSSAAIPSLLMILLINFSKTAMQRAIASAISQTAEQIISIMNKVTLNAWKWSRGLLN